MSCLCPQPEGVDDIPVAPVYTRLNRVVIAPVAHQNPPQRRLDSVTTVVGQRCCALGVPGSLE
jgi:hypothetical protein